MQHGQSGGQARVLGETAVSRRFALDVVKRHADDRPVAPFSGGDIERAQLIHVIERVHPAAAALPPRGVKRTLRQRPERFGRRVPQDDAAAGGGLSHWAETDGVLRGGVAGPAPAAGVDAVGQLVRPQESEERLRALERRGGDHRALRGIGQPGAQLIFADRPRFPRRLI